MGSMGTGRGDRILQLDGLRGLAAVAELVVYLHQGSPQASCAQNASEYLHVDVHATVVEHHHIVWLQRRRLKQVQLLASETA